MALKVEQKDNKLYIEIDLEKPTRSTSGKTLVVASTRGMCAVPWKCSKRGALNMSSSKAANRGIFPVSAALVDLLQDSI